MKKDRPTFYVALICFLCLFPMSVYGTYFMFFETDSSKVTSGFLFYENDEVIGSYDCSNTDCDYFIDDEGNELGIISSTFAFLQDGSEIKLINLLNGSVVLTYDYVSFALDDLVIASIDGLYGAYNKTDLKTSIDFIYEDLILQDDNTFIANTNYDGYILSQDGEVIAYSYYGAYTYYSSMFYISYDGSYYYVFDNMNDEYYSNYDIEYFSYTENYFILGYKGYLFVYDDLMNSALSYYAVDDFENIIFLEENNNYIVYKEDVQIN